MTSCQIYVMFSSVSPTAKRARTRAALLIALQELLLKSGVSCLHHLNGALPHCAQPSFLLVGSSLPPGE